MDLVSLIFSVSAQTNENYSFRHFFGSFCYQKLQRKKWSKTVPVKLLKRFKMLPHKRLEMWWGAQMCGRILCSGARNPKICRGGRKFWAKFGKNDQNSEFCPFFLTTPRKPNFSCTFPFSNFPHFSPHSTSKRRFLLLLGDSAPLSHREGGGAGLHRREGIRRRHLIRPSNMTYSSVFRLIVINIFR